LFEAPEEKRQLIAPVDRSNNEAKTRHAGSLSLT
jgi:hypothetical protein